MDREEQFRRNLKYAAEFLEGLIDNPEALERLPDASIVVSMPADDLELCAANEQMIRSQRARTAGKRSRRHAAALDDTTLLVNV